MLIYQILGNFLKYSEVIFTCENLDYKCKLSSEALYNYYKNCNIENIVLLKPESLTINNSSMNIIDDNIVDDKVKEKTEIIPIQAVGTFNNIPYNGTPTNISLQIFANMINRTIDKNCPEIIIDLSTGYNLYVLSLLEAARFYTSYMRLSFNNYSRPIVKYAISEPVHPVHSANEPVRSANAKYKIYVEDLETRTKFDLPEYSSLTECIDTNDNTKKELGCKFSNIIKRLKEIHNNLRLTYNAIIYNAPLFLFSNRIVFGDEFNNRKIVECLCTFIGEILKYKDIKIKRCMYNLFLIVAMYDGIRHILKDLVNKADGTSLDILKQFKSIYDKLDLDLNWRLLDNEISKIECCKDHIHQEWKSYKEIMKSCLSNKLDEMDNKMWQSDSKRNLWKSDSKRNFFAHAGLSYDTLQLRLDSGNILCKYNNEKEIQKWIENP